MKQVNSQEQDHFNELTSVFFNNEEWVVPRKYQLNAVIGHGAYGTVASATNLETGQEVAIKRNKNIFPKFLCDITLPPEKRKSTSKAVIPVHRSCISQLRILRELKVLIHVDHPNIIPLHEVILPQSFEKFTDVYFVTELMEADLRDLFESNMTLETEHVRYMTYQLICAVNHLHQCDIIHRDIKPENILINSDCSLRLCDLGLARGCLFEGRDEHLEKTTRLSTNYVQTRPYRAPELILNSNRVGKSSDMWAVGCILAEMLNNGEILFNGQSNQEQIFTIIQTMGTPSPASLHGSTAGIEFVNKLEYVQPNPEWYLEVFPRHSTDQMALDLLSRLLQFDFQKRISAREALEHPFFDSCRDPKHYNTVTKTFNFDFERKLVVSDEEAIITYGNLVKKECYDTILKFHGIVEKQEESKTDTATTKAPSIFNKMKSFLKKNKV